MVSSASVGLRRRIIGAIFYDDLRRCQYEKLRRLGSAARERCILCTVRFRLAPVLVGLLILGASAVFAQQIWVAGRPGAPHWANLQDFDGSFLYCRGFYRSVVREAGGQGWSTDYPGADNNFSVRLMELTKVPVKLDVERQPNFVVVRLDDPLLYRCPMLFMEDVGTLQFTEAEVRNLRDFFLKGGFLWVDDFWGSDAWVRWESELRRVLPEGVYPIFDIPLSHPIMHTLYDVSD